MGDENLHLTIQARFMKVEDSHKALRTSAMPSAKARGEMPATQVLVDSFGDEM